MLTCLSIFGFFCIKRHRDILTEVVASKASARLIKIIEGIIEAVLARTVDNFYI